MNGRIILAAVVNPLLRSGSLSAASVELNTSRDQLRAVSPERVKPIALTPNRIMISRAPLQKEKEQLVNSCRALLSSLGPAGLGDIARRKYIWRQSSQARPAIH